MIEYEKLPGLVGFYLEDSYVLEILEGGGQLVFKIDAVLTPEHPAYHSPHPGDQYCYAMARLVFPNVTRVQWIQRAGHQYTDADGERDLGNIDVLDTDGTSFTAQGDWGHVRIDGEQPYMVIDG